MDLERSSTDIPIDASPEAKIRRHRKAGPEEVGKLSRVTGEGMTKKLTEMDIRLYYDLSARDRKSKDDDAGNINFWEKFGLAPNNYTRNDYAFVLDDRVVLITSFNLNEASRPTGAPRRVVEFDFAFLDDWNNPRLAQKKYIKSRPAKEAGGRGLVTEGLHFLKRMRSILESVDRDCLIQLNPSDHQYIKLL